LPRRYANNWELGRRGFKATLDDIQQKELLNCWVQNDWKNAPAKEMLSSRHDIELPVRTLAEYKSRFRKRWDEISNSPDRTIEWNNFPALAAHNIPSHLLFELRSMADQIEIAHLEGQGTLMNGENVKPTYRSVKWWAYIIQYFGPYIPSVHDREIIAEQYATREFTAQFNNSDFVRDDLDKWLLYRPWETEQRENTYLQAISDGKFTALQLAREEYGLNRAENTFTNEGRFVAVGLSVINKFISLSPKPYLLPTEIWERYREETITTFKENFLQEEASEE